MAGIEEPIDNTQRRSLERWYVAVARQAHTRGQEALASDARYQAGVASVADDIFHAADLVARLRTIDATPEFDERLAHTWEGVALAELLEAADKAKTAWQAAMAKCWERSGDILRGAPAGSAPSHTVKGEPA